MPEERGRLAVAMGERAGGGFATCCALISGALSWLIAIPRFGAYHEPPLGHLHEYVTSRGSVLVGLSVDMREYLLATDYFAGRGPAPTLAPFTARFAAPWIAGRLPWDAPTSLNLVVMSFLTVGLLALTLSWWKLGVSRQGVLVGCFGWAVSFPVFYWGSFNYVDGTVVGLLGCLLLALVYGRLASAMAVVFVSILFKESGLVGVPVVIAWVLAQDSPRFGRRNKILLSSVACVTAVVGLVAARLLGPESTHVYNTWLASPHEIAGYFGSNIGRAGPGMQVLLTGLVPVSLVMVAGMRWQSKELTLPTPVLWACVAGVVTGGLLNVQALFTAQWDGRTLWTVYPFALTLGAAALSRPAPVDAHVA